MIVRGKHVPTPVCLQKKACVPDTSLDAIERFIKDEIGLIKTCGCGHCNYRRQMLRAIQYVLNDYRNIHQDHYNWCNNYKEQKAPECKHCTHNKQRAIRKD